MGRCYPFEEARKDLLFCPGSEYQELLVAVSLQTWVLKYMIELLGTLALEKNQMQPPGSLPSGEKNLVF